MKHFLFLIIALTVSIPAFAQTYTVERVIDGDTLKLTSGETIQLIGINAPDVGSEGAEEATDYLKNRFGGYRIPTSGGKKNVYLKGLEGEEVYLEFDVQKKDKYDLLLAYVFILYPVASYPPNDFIYDPLEQMMKDKDGGGKYKVFVNATQPIEPPTSVGGWIGRPEGAIRKRNNNWIEAPDFSRGSFTVVNAGYATPRTIQPNVKYAELFNELYQEARVDKKGIWKGEGKGFLYERINNAPEGLHELKEKVISLIYGPLI